MSIQTPIRRILVIKNRAIGDTILMTGPLRLLRKHFPHHKIHVIVRAPAGELLEGLPYIDRIISTKEPQGKFDRFTYWLRLTRTLREHRYEYVLNFHASFRTALFGQCLRVDQCIANHHELKGRSWFSDVAVPGRGQVKSIIDRDLDVLRALGLNVDAIDALPELMLYAFEKETANQYFKDDLKLKRIFLGIGGSRETKRWTAQHFAKLLEKIAQKYNVLFVLATIQNDQKWMNDFYSNLSTSIKSKVKEFNNLQLRQVAQIASTCSAYIGNDSGLKHLSAALGLPTFTFFGPEHPLEWHPYDLGQHPYMFIENLPCRTESGKHWCAVESCTKHHHQCMSDLTVEKVWPKIEKFLEGIC